MRVLITGVTGFVGGFMLRALGERKRGEPELHLIATARRRQLPPDLDRWADEFIDADLSDSLPPVDAAVCIHAAGLADDRSTALELQRANVVATRNLLVALRGCRVFIYVSSASVYGIKDGPLREEDAAAETALSDYGRSKWAAEQIVRETCNERGIAHFILRPRAIYGAGDRVLLPRLRRLMRPPLLLMLGDGDAPMSLTYIGHLAAVISGLGFGPKTPSGGTFNVADADVYRLKPVLTALYTAIHHAEPRVRRIPSWLAAGYAGFNEMLGLRGGLSRQSLGYLTQPCVLDCTRARTVLGYAPSTTFFDHVEEITG